MSCDYSTAFDRPLIVLLWLMIAVIFILVLNLASLLVWAITCDVKDWIRRRRSRR